MARWIAQGCILLFFRASAITAAKEKIAATVIYYGSLETNVSKLSVIEWPVLGILGSLDTSIPIASVKNFENKDEITKEETEVEE